MPQQTDRADAPDGDPARRRRGLDGRVPRPGPERPPCVDGTPAHVWELGRGVVADGRCRRCGARRRFGGRDADPWRLPPRAGPGAGGGAA